MFTKVPRPEQKNVLGDQAGRRTWQIIQMAIKHQFLPFRATRNNSAKLPHKEVSPTQIWQTYPDPIWRLVSLLLGKPRSDTLLSRNCQIPYGFW